MVNTLRNEPKTILRTLSIFGESRAYTSKGVNLVKDGRSRWSDGSLATKVNRLEGQFTRYVVVLTGHRPTRLSEEIDVVSATAQADNLDSGVLFERCVLQYYCWRTVLHVSDLD